MSRFKKMPEDDANFTHVFYCQGCGFLHGIDSRWQFNGDFESPTISPSYVIDGTRGGKDFKCHSFVKEGKIQFLTDSTHKLSGQTVELYHEEDWFKEEEE